MKNVNKYNLKQKVFYNKRSATITGVISLPLDGTVYQLDHNTAVLVPEKNIMPHFFQRGEIVKDHNTGLFFRIIDHLPDGYKCMVMDRETEIKFDQTKNFEVIK